MSDYAQQRARELTFLIRGILRELPEVCSDFIRSIEHTTQPLTRYAYVSDLKLFFHYLTSENPRFADTRPEMISVAQLNSLTARDLRMYLEYLSLYIKDESQITNGQPGKMRKLASLRSFYKFLFKNELIEADVAQLIDMPKRHEKPITRLEIDEVVRMLDLVESGEKLSERQKKYNQHTRTRDLAILTLFLDTGIRVSELVGINISDIDFSINGFLVTRKGGNQTILYFSDEVEAVLRDYLKLRKEIAAQPGDEDALFLSLQNKRISVRAVQMMVKKYATQAAPLKKNLSPHKLRSTFGTNLYHETGDIYLVADFLGHSDVNTTRRHYAAMSDDRRRVAARKIRSREDFHPDMDEAEKEKGE